MQKKSLLIIGAVWVEPNSSAAGKRMLQLIHQFLERDYAITFASPSQKSEKAIDLISLGITEVSIELNNASFDDFIKELEPNIVMFDRFMMEEQFGWRVAENYPKAIRILDTEDLHCLRKTRELCFKKNIDFSTEELLKQDITKREIAAILRCDLSLIISTFEMQLLKNTFKIDESILMYVPFLFDEIGEHQQKKWKIFEERQDFIFIGNFFHKPNVAAVLTLKNEIWNEIRKQLPKAEVHIYGAYMNQQIEQLHNKKEGFIVKGFAANANEVVENARVVLAPLNFGAGIKGKLTEAMLCGTPSVTTSIGAEGMAGKFPWNGFIEDDFSDYALKAIELYTNKSAWRNAQLNGVNIINCIYSKEKNGELLFNKIEEIQQNIAKHRTHNFFGSLLQHQTLQATKYMSKWIEAKNK
ncbi:glycosyltransferase [Polaribacter sp. IC073]|uniref:glycosyltransferase n=1 Tax=Polaribacter sp. IC073 TaxID=2508540 RepID=UPI0011BDE3D8|nr:glycosyltransferase [Polaribacter sp. IC073]TXD47886.1 glycosyltransferase family 4 protein [Polaribacter sp. IC073]